MIKMCAFCNNEFITKDKRQKYCDRVCYSNAKKLIKNKVIVKCSYCGKNIERYPSQVLNKVFCSKECLKTYNKENNIIIFKCEICNKETIAKKSSYDNSKHHYCSYKCANKGNSIYYSGENAHNYGIQMSDEQKKLISITKINQNLRGYNSPNYNPDKPQEEREKERKYPEYYEFIRKVYERDNYTCQCCGNKRGGNLVAHHLNGYNWDKEHRTDVNNGITLCENCHKKFHHIYGYGNNTKEQFEEFNNNYNKSI